MVAATAAIAANWTQIPGTYESGDSAYVGVQFSQIFHPAAVKSAGVSWHPANGKDFRSGLPASKYKATVYHCYKVNNNEMLLKSSLARHALAWFIVSKTLIRPNIIQYWVIFPNDNLSILSN
jgi:hypothetical protein